MRCKFLELNGETQLMDECNLFEHMDTQVLDILGNEDCECTSDRRRDEDENNKKKILVHIQCALHTNVFRIFTYYPSPGLRGGFRVWVWSQIQVQTLESRPVNYFLNPNPISLKKRP